MQMTEQQKKELIVEIEKCESTLSSMEFMKNNASDDITKNTIENNLISFRKHIEHMKNMLGD